VISQLQGIVISSDYPLRPSKLKFITKVYHPNISSASGAINLNILNEDWCPALTLRTILISLQALLSSPYPNDPLDADVAKHYMTSK
jgi:ubiquitin-conjugating enzyme (huntingtin interacting protein 2)